MFKFSIIIPIFNAELYLAECIDSILKQTYKNFEIILVDDGSIDSSPKICDEYSIRFSFIKSLHKKNEGPFYARQFGVSNSTGDYCMFVDADDRIVANCLEVISNVLSSKNDMLIFEMFEWNPTNRYVCPRARAFNDAVLFTFDNLAEIRKKFLTTDTLNSMAIKVVKSSILKSDSTKYGNGSHSPYGEDAMQSFYLFDKCENIIYLPTPLYYYRLNPNSTTHSAKTFSKIQNIINLDVDGMRKDYGCRWGVWDKEVEKSTSILRIQFIKNIFVHNYLLINDKLERKAFLFNDWESFFLDEQKVFLRAKYFSILFYIEMRSVLKHHFFVCELFRKWRLVLRKKRQD